MKVVKFLNNKPVRVYALNNGYWYAIKDICDAINFPEDSLTYRLDSNELDCYVKPLEFGPFSVRCISHEGLETCCYRNDIDECYQVQDWIKDLYIPSEDDKMIPIKREKLSGKEIINGLIEIKGLCEYFDIDPKDERVCSLVNAILDELE